MTLVLTKIAPDGIVMAADAVLTESYKKYNRFLTGASKLLPHAPSCTCIGMWGGAVLPNPVPNAHPVALEFVLREFLDTAKSIDNAKDLVDKLKTWLGEHYLTARQVIGIDVASVRATRHKSWSVVYRLMNAKSLDAKPTRWFKISTLRRPTRSYEELTDKFIITAGDVNAGIWVDEIRAAMLHAAFHAKKTIPNNIQGISSWLSAIVRSVSDMYQSLDIGQTIGGPVSVIALRARDHKIINLSSGATWPEER